jgi:AraC-like DNA-binding protein
VPSGDSGDDSELFTIARWHDVHDARRRIVRSKRDDLLLQLRAHEYSQEEMATVMGDSQPTISRRIKATLRELLDELGGGQRSHGERAVTALEAALTKATRTRAQLAA